MLTVNNLNNFKGVENKHTVEQVQKSWTKPDMNDVNTNDYIQLLIEK